MAQAASIFLATPCYGGLAHIHFMRSVLDLQAACAARGVGLTVELGGGDALITRARAAMADKFLKSGASHLLFVDADIGFKPEQVFRLLDADRDLVGGVYPIKSIDWTKVRQAAADGKRDLMAASVGYVVRFIPTPDSRVEVDDDGFGPVAYIGTGFMLIKRAVVEQVAAAHPELKARLGDTSGGGTSHATMIFETFIEAETGEHLSEDYAFCRRWRDLGGQVFADFQTRLTHVGHAAYAGSLMDAQAR
ncbi:hypothetical protein JKL49_01800 [Phenylobacterium sp. 20VBR1]|uniref:Uncharacterized protein n=1 Tax=Phenylobacterium glaciei TaxID=2803784 RepID=A0A941HUY2_9CAUL|nr:hypothetical protein [Phenylobacterium glaciei]MBR7618108.1 hypothetical protein [Phenylobacterium glaciei]